MCRSPEGFIDVGKLELCSADFASLYPSIPHDDLISKIRIMVNYLFSHKKNEFNQGNKLATSCEEAVVVLEKHPSVSPARWEHEKPSDDTLSQNEVCLTADLIVQLVEYVIKNSYCKFAKQIFRITRGFPTGSNFSPEAANIYLLYYELTYAHRRLKVWSTLSKGEKLAITHWKRYIDDVFTPLHDKFSVESILYKSESKDGIFPEELIDKGIIIKKPLDLNIEKGIEVNYLDVTVKADKRANNLAYRVYDKREHLEIGGIILSSLRNFPDVESKLSRQAKLSCIVSEMYRFNRRTNSQKEFVQKVLQMVNKRIEYGYRKKGMIEKVLSYDGWVTHTFGSLGGSWIKTRTELIAKIKRSTTVLKSK